MENNFLKLFEAAKWGDTIDNQALATVHRTLVDLPSCNQEEDFTHNYSYALLVFGMTSSNSNNTISFWRKSFWMKLYFAILSEERLYRCFAKIIITETHWNILIC